LSNNFVQVNVDDRALMFFAGLVSGAKTADVGAQAKCGVVLANAPIPILVLDPRNETSLSVNGKITIAIVGGPQRSIQVNATSTSAVNVAGASGSIDLTQGGPNNNGSDFGVTGVESAVGIFKTANSGQWVDPTPAISDPFATVPAPTAVTALPVPPTGTDAVAGCTSIPCPVPTGIHGCQDSAGCRLYTAGLYTSDIQSFQHTLLFDPGIYYMRGANLVAAAQSCLRPGTGVGDGSGGTMFYFTGTTTTNAGTINVAANAGTNGVCGTTTAVPLSSVRCINSGTGTTTLPANVVTNGGLIGNVLIGPCQKPTVTSVCGVNCTYNYGDPLGPNDPLGEQRGMLFFQDRSSNLAAETPKNQPSWGGGGAFGLTGIMYFHYCNSADGAGKGTNCNSGAYTDQLSLQGVAASNTFVIGDIITDQLSLGGNPTIEMDLNPTALYYVLKASLLQ
jgi:hypothetical protein